MQTINEKDDGYRGIWYMNQPSNDEYVFKYSGGLATYCAKHQPFAVYSQKAKKTFFCYGGTSKDDYRKLHHMVSYYDHVTGMVPRPTILLDKETEDAHDNPVISMDTQGYIWIFSTSHGISRPSYIHRSREPYSIDEFELVNATRIEDGKEIPFVNFSYMQVWNLPKHGFVAFLTHYHDPAARTSFFITSQDGIQWSQWKKLAAIQEGHYQISAVCHNKVATAFNFHPAGNGLYAVGEGLNWRTNLYYMETCDRGDTWQTVDGKRIDIPLMDVANPSLVCDYQKQGLNVYLKDIQFDEEDKPVILYLTSRGYEAGPENAPRTWTIAYWDGEQWIITPAMEESDSNYDTGSLYIEGKGHWRIIAPTGNGPQPFNPGGEVAMWITENYGKSWIRIKQLTKNSEYNHTYVRCPVNANSEFYALWADGHARQPSSSRIYFSDKEGCVWVLPEKMDDDFVAPALLIT